MTEHKEVEQWIEIAGETIEQAQLAFEDSKRVQPGDPEDYVEAQLRLEEVGNHLDALLRVATPEQRDQLDRTQQQVRQLQSHLIHRQ